SRRCASGWPPAAWQSPSATRWRRTRRRSSGRCWPLAEQLRDDLLGDRALDRLRPEAVQQGRGALAVGADAVLRQVERDPQRAGQLGGVELARDQLRRQL